jgi:hypothetical protein
LQVNVLELSQEELEAEMAAEESDEEVGGNVDEGDGEVEVKKKERKQTGMFASARQVLLWHLLVCVLRCWVCLPTT